jgi:hypothetical protein
MDVAALRELDDIELSEIVVVAHDTNAAHALRRTSASRPADASLQRHVAHQSP